MIQTTGEFAVYSSRNLSCDKPENFTVVIIADAVTAGCFVGSRSTSWRNSAGAQPGGGPVPVNTVAPLPEASATSLKRSTFIFALQTDVQFYTENVLLHSLPKPNVLSFVLTGAKSSFVFSVLSHGCEVLSKCTHSPFELVQSNSSLLGNNRDLTSVISAACSCCLWFGLSLSTVLRKRNGPCKVHTRLLSAQQNRASPPKILSDSRIESKNQLQSSFERIRSHSECSELMSSLCCPTCTCTTLSLCRMQGTKRVRGSKTRHPQIAGWLATWRCGQILSINERQISKTKAAKPRER